MEIRQGRMEARRDGGMWNVWKLGSDGVSEKQGERWRVQKGPTTPGLLLLVGSTQAAELFIEAFLLWPGLSLSLLSP